MTFMPDERSPYPWEMGGTPPIMPPQPGQPLPPWMQGGQSPTFQRSPMGNVPMRGPGILQRIMAGLMPIPSALEGMMSPQDIQAARKQGLLSLGASLLESGGPVVGAPAPSLGQAIGRALGAGQQGMQGALGNTMQMRQFAAEQQEAQKKQAMEQQREALRKQITEKYPIDPNAPPQVMARQLQGMYNEFIRIGDMESAGKIGEVLKSQSDLLGGGKPQMPEFFNRPGAGGTVRINPDGTTSDLPYVAPPQQGAAPGSVSERERLNSTEAKSIYDDFRADTKSLQDAAIAYSVIQGSKDGTNPAQPIALLYAYARLLDPGSVVREGEIATLQKMGAVDDKVRRAIQFAASGTLPQDIIDYVVRQAGSVMEQRRSMFNTFRGTALQRAKRAGLDMSQLLNDPYAGFAPTTSRTPGTGSADTVRKFLKPPG
jgi:hypothetical protein